MSTKEAKFNAQITWRGFYGNSNGLFLVYYIYPLDKAYKLVPDSFHSLKDLRAKYKLKRLKKNGTYAEWRKFGGSLTKPVYLTEVDEKFLVKI